MEAQIDCHESANVSFSIGVHEKVKHMYIAPLGVVRGAVPFGVERNNNSSIRWRAHHVLCLQQERTTISGNQCCMYG